MIDTTGILWWEILLSTFDIVLRGLRLRYKSSNNYYIQSHRSYLQRKDIAVEPFFRNASFTRGIAAVQQMRSGIKIELHIHKTF